MAEQELKLCVPQHSRNSIEKELARGTVTRIPMRALYFDTANRALVKSKISLRLRQEGRQWVQTLKMPGENALSRVELNHDRPGPILDLSVYVGTVAEPGLANLTDPLQVCYETDINRTVRKIRTKHGLVEVAYDLGIIRAGHLDLPVSEVEFELVTGELDALFYLGKKWQRAYGLIYDARSKAERGDRLATLAGKLAAVDGAQADPSSADSPTDPKREVAWFWQQRGIGSVQLNPSMSTATALSKVMAECLDQIARNAAVLAEVDTANVCKAGTPDHVHQLRVGIRRLRSAWSLFNGLTDLPPIAMREEIKRHFSQLGGTRDDDVLRETWLPVLEASGQPPIRLDSGVEADNASELCGGKAFQSWILDMLAWTVGVDLSPPAQAVVSLPEPIAQSWAEAVAAAEKNRFDGNTADTSSGIANGGVSHGNPLGTHPMAVGASENHGAETGPTSISLPAMAAADTSALSASFATMLQPQIIPLTAKTPVEAAVELSLTETLSNKLKKWHKQVTREGLIFDELDIEARHELRKRAKRLRYCLQFSESLLPENRLKQYRKELAVVQDVLGEMNDLAVARERFEGLKKSQPHAWFAVGWITSRLDVLTHDAVKAFKGLAEAERPWR